MALLPKTNSIFDNFPYDNLSSSFVENTTDDFISDQNNTKDIINGPEEMSAQER